MQLMEGLCGRPGRRAFRRDARIALLNDGAASRYLYNPFVPSMGSSRRKASR